MALTPLPLNPATGGASIATDLVSGNSYQLVKLVSGDSGSAGVIVGPSNSLPVSVVASASGGATPYHLVSAATTNATNIKGSAGQFYSMAGYNNSASNRYLKLYDKATAPTVGTDTPIWVMMLPAGTGANLSLPISLSCASGLSFAITGGIADNDATSIGAGDCVVDLLYK